MLRLVLFSGFEERNRDHHRIRVLQIGRRCKVLEELKAWSKSSPNEYKKAVNGLRRIAENQDLPRLNTIKRVGRKHEIVQISAGRARLYCFSDSDDGYTVVCVNTFWIGKGNKRTMQAKAIRCAEELMARWQNAEPLDEVPYTRIENRRRLNRRHGNE